MVLPTGSVLCIIPKLPDPIMHNHCWKHLLAEASAPACPGLVVGSPIRDGGPPLVARTGHSPVIPSG